MATDQPHDRASIDAAIARIKEEIREIGDDACANAYYTREHGLSIGPKGHQLFTGGEADWEAPKPHPVWADALEREADILEQMGAATFEYEPTRDKLRQWDAATRPEFEYDRRGDFYLYMTGPQYDQWLAGGGGTSGSRAGSCRTCPGSRHDGGGLYPQSLWQYFRNVGCPCPAGPGSPA